jgi:hypothetical protein
MLEYFLLIGIVLLVVSFMGVDFKRGLQSVIKVTADQIGNQANADQDYTSPRGFMINSVTSFNQEHQQTQKDVKGVITTESIDSMSTGTTVVTNQGVIQ